MKNLKISSISSLVKDVRSWKRRSKKIIFTNGCFDLMHIGHTRFLKKAKSYGDILIVGLNSDLSVKNLKGKGRPILTLKERAELLLSTKWVDAVVSFSDPTPLKLIQKIKPHVLIKGGDWKIKDIVGSEVVLKNKGKVISGIYIKGRSTTQIINKIKKFV